MACPWRIAVFLSALMFVTPVSAADRAGFYTGLRLVGSVADLQNLETQGLNGSYAERHGDDLVGGGGGVVGYRWGRLPFRTEMEVAHRVRFDWDFRDDGTPNVGYENNLDSTNVLFNILFTPNFLSIGTFNANLTQVSTIVIVAVGMTFVIATGGIDLSVGSLMAIAGVLAPLFLVSANQFGAPAIGLALAILAPLVAAGGVGGALDVVMSPVRSGCQHGIKRCGP